jgi:hypothetical protein
LRIRWNRRPTDLAALDFRLDAWAGTNATTGEHKATAFSWGFSQSRLKQARLPDDRLNPAYVLYLGRNWIRVAIFTAAALLQLWIALVHFSVLPR